jgi:hypothetical protein
MLWNIEGASSVLSSNNSRELLNNCDIIMLTETFLLGHDQAATALPNDYCHFLSHARPNRRGRPSGGLAILTKPNLDAELVYAGENSIVVSTTVAIAACFYYAPDYSIDHLTLDVHDTLSRIPSHLPIIVGGDFNCRTDRYGERTEILLTTLHSVGLTMVNCANTPTYMCPNGSSTIDLLLTTLAADMSKTPQIVLSPVRKHQRVTGAFNCAPPNCKENQQIRYKRTINEDTLSTHPALDTFQAAAEVGDVEQAAEAIREVFVSATDKARPYNGHHQRWFDDECKQQKRMLTRMLKEMHRTRTNDQNFWALRREYTTIIRTKKRAYNARLLQKRINDSAVTPWVLFKPAAGRTPPALPPVTAAAWQQHFNELYNPQRVQPDFTPLIEPSVPPRWCSAPFTQDEIAAVIEKAAIKKASGPDGLYYEHFKNESAILLMTKLFNVSLRTGQIPSSWRQCLLKPLFKKGQPNDPNNYRGIALLNCQFKLLTAAINRRLADNAFHELPPEQHGFQRGRSTSRPIRELVDCAKNTLADRGGCLYALFVDFHKAFDVVDRKLLITKIQQTFHVSGQILALICNILTYNELIIPTVPIPIRQHRGVAQGDSLSPTLFIMYAADLASQLRSIGNCAFSFYADDLVVYSPDPRQIDSALTILRLWCTRNKMQVNTGKTKVMKFRRGGRLRNDDRFTFGEENIEIVNSYEYLGVTLQPTLSFDKHIQRKKAACFAATGALQHLPLVALETAVVIFNMKIRPIIEYSLAEIAARLTHNQLLEIDKVKAAFLKRTLGLHSSVSSTFTHALSTQAPLCHDLRAIGIPFSDNAWMRYDAHCEERGWAFVEQNFTDGVAFTTEGWKAAHQKWRHFATRHTFHGFHWRICSTAGWHEPNDDCRCRLCNQSASERYHIDSCPAYQTPLIQRLRTLF